MRQQDWTYNVFAPRPPLPLLDAFAGIRFGLIFADCPWLYANWTKKKNGSHRPHYAGMSLDDLKSLPVAQIAAKDCLLLQWATGPKMDEAIDVLKAWKFEYTTVLFVWTKLTKDGNPRPGPGWHSRPSTEFVLLGKRGKGSADDRTVRQLIEAPVRGHSVKPDEPYKLTQRLYPDHTPRLELFARQPRHGWHVWGDQVIEPTTGGRTSPTGVATGGSP